MKISVKSSAKRYRLSIKKLPYIGIVISSLMFLAMACEAKTVQGSVSSPTPQKSEQTQSSNMSKERSAISRHAKRIQFKPGTSSALIENSVVRGSRDIYLIQAKKGQRIHGQITSTENNAVIDVLAPNGKSIQQEVTKIDMLLPSTGDFQIVVGGTRGNASYRLNIGVD
jgi:23S rRNA pseudoU1915 N3-methylase RlmH